MSDSAVVLLVGTRRGLFRFTADADRRRWRIRGPYIAGYEIHHAILDPRSAAEPPAGYAAARHDVWGAHLYRTDDGGESWGPLAARPAFPESGEVKAIWYVAAGGESAPDRIYAGVQPAALFVSEDRGGSWRWIRTLEEHPGRAAWQPAKGGLALHSIQVDPRDPDRLYVAVSAGGVYRTDDGGRAWKACNDGLRADFLREARPEAGQCIHALRLHPAAPDRLYQQTHCGTYRSDDRGESWTEITSGLPSDFGYPIGLDPGDPDRCWVVPEESRDFRVVCGAALRVFETGDGGATWKPRTEGLPQAHAYVTVLREAMATDGLDPCGVYFGTATGHLYGSRDGRRWRVLASHLPKILCVTATTLVTGKQVADAPQPARRPASASAASRTPRRRRSCTHRRPR